MRSSSGFSMPSSSMRPGGLRLRRVAVGGGRVEAAAEDLGEQPARLPAARPAPPPRSPARSGKPTCLAQRNIARSSQHSRQSRPARSTRRLNPSASAAPSSSACSAPRIVVEARSSGQSAPGLQRDRHAAPPAARRPASAGSGTSSTARRSRLSNSGSASASGSGPPALARRSVSSRGPAPGGAAQVGAAAAPPRWRARRAGCRRRPAPRVALSR